MPSYDIKVPLQDRQATLTRVDILNIVFCPTANITKKAQAFFFKSVYRKAPQ
jgi:hypothetical protein